MIKKILITGSNGFIEKLTGIKKRFRDIWNWKKKNQSKKLLPNKFK